jgi:hypothetical protein
VALGAFVIIAAAAATPMMIRFISSLLPFEACAAPSASPHHRIRTGPCVCIEFFRKNKISGQPKNKIPSVAKDQRCTAQAAGNISLNP